MNVFTIDTNFKKLKEGALNILFPKECVGCRSEGSYLCQICLGTIFINEKFSCPNCEDPTIFGATCSRCLRRDFPLNSLISTTSYRDKFIREAISSLKYKGCKSVVDDLRVLLRKFFIKYNDVFPSFDIIIPVPLHPWRLEERGFNQSELIAKKIYEAKPRTSPPISGTVRDTLRRTPQGALRQNPEGEQVPYGAGKFGAEQAPRLKEGGLASTVLHRITNNPPQVDFSPKERSQNVAGIFKVTRPELLAGKSILLVDDVYTTGATMQECARVLKSVGARKIHGFVIARG